SARRTTFSKNTIASSTRKPMANVSAINVRLLIEKLSMYITATVSSNDIGSATAGISVSVARPRKTYMTSTTSTKAMISVHFTSSAELTMVCDRSNTGVNLIEPGKLARSSGNSAFTELATSTAFAPACRETASTTTDP